MSGASIQRVTSADPGDVEAWVDPGTHVGTLEIRRPPHNFFDGDSMARTVALAHELAERGARALVLCSAGRNFSAGADFVGESDSRRSDDIYETGLKLLAQPLPLVAAMQGKTIGGGVGLALVADFRVASPESVVWINFARIGLHHGFGLSVTLPRVVGPQAAAELLLTGRRIDGTTAHRMGLCDRLVPADRIRAEATSLAAEIAANAPLATRAIRATLRGRLADDARAAMEQELAVQFRLMETEDFREGVAAVHQRRPATFHGR